MRRTILAGLCLLASPAPALADAPSYACAKAAPTTRLTVQLAPSPTLRDLGVWITSFTCRSVVYDGEAAMRATRLALSAPAGAITPLQAVQLFVDAIQKAGLAVAEKPDAFVITDPSPQRRCSSSNAVSAFFGVQACAKPPDDAKLAIRIRPDASLIDLATWVGGFTCKPVDFDPSIGIYGPSFNLIVSAPLTPKQASRLFVDAVETTGLVVTEKADVFEVKPGPRWSQCAAAPAAPATPDQDPALTAEIEAGIRKIDDTHYEIKRSVVDKVFANPMAFAKGARVVPAMKDGKPEGFKLYAIRVTSAWAKLGIQNGDTIQSVNGFSLDSVDKALEVYTKLKSAKRLDVSLVRRGKPLSITYTIVK